MTPWYQKPEWWAVVVALFLGLYGIFRELITGIFYRPKLSIDLIVKKPDCHKTTFNGQIPCYYYRFRVTNNGNAAAKNVEIFINKKFTLNGKTRYEEDTNFLPMNLKWSHDGAEVRESIAPNLLKFADLGSIIHPDYKDKVTGQFGISTSSKVVLNLDLVVLPNTGSSLLFPGRHKLQVWLIARNHKIVKHTFLVDFPDKWFDSEDKMLAEGVQIRKLIHN